MALLIQEAHLEGPHTEPGCLLLVLERHWELVHDGCVRNAVDLSAIIVVELRLAVDVSHDQNVRAVLEDIPHAFFESCSLVLDLFEHIDDVFLVVKVRSDVSSIVLDDDVTDKLFEIPGLAFPLRLAHDVAEVSSNVHVVDVSGDDSTLRVRDTVQVASLMAGVVVSLQAPLLISVGNLDHDRGCLTVQHLE